MNRKDIKVSALQLAHRLSILSRRHDRRPDRCPRSLDAHPDIEVRLYNPLMERNARLLNFVSDFTRVNHRTHNKSFTVDNQVTIVGGRNIANEYFGAGTGVTLTDLDVIAAGEAARAVSREFDPYWNSASAYPAASLVGLPGAAPPGARGRTHEVIFSFKTTP